MSVDFSHWTKVNAGTHADILFCSWTDRNSGILRIVRRVKTGRRSIKVCWTESDLTLESLHNKLLRLNWHAVCSPLLGNARLPEVDRLKKSVCNAIARELVKRDPTLNASALTLQ
ncbi:hypothetical protein HY631_04085 [Candidatus Uhrbacteria bacterium]|nr:hypothetical protein [Candidatus Uhrbacteria bacterium]